MSDEERPPDDDAAPSGDEARAPYEPPALTWEEEFAPVGLAVSCARFPGQSAGCNQVPGT
jgi:hypothetical protein